MAFPGVPQFYPGLNLQSGDVLNAFVHNTLSADSNLRAFPGGGQQFATLVDSVVCVVSRVGSIGDSIQLPPTNGPRNFGPYLGGLQLIMINSTGNACTIYTNWFEPLATINGGLGSVGVSIAAGTVLWLVCVGVKTWITISTGGGGGSSGLPLTGGTLIGFLGLTTADGLTAGGTAQSSAVVLTSQVSVAASCPAGTGFRLPALTEVTILGPITFKNKDPSNSVLVYPPLGGQIDSYPSNQAVIIPSLDEVNFAPGVTNGRWWS